MKKVLFALLFICLCVGVQAQRVYFMYVQSENGAPFYVKMGDQIHSSTSSGYVILSSLKDSTYVFSLGYPGPQSSETKFSVPIAGADKGFLIKKLDDGLALFDLQNLTLLKAFSANNKGNNLQTTTRTDPFTKLLSQTSNDASLLTVSVPVKEAPPAKTEVVKAPAQKPVTDAKATEVVPEVVKETNTAVSQVEQVAEKAEAEKTTPPPVIAAVEKTEPAKVVVKEEEVKAPLKEVEISEAEEASFVRSKIRRRSESSTTEGFGLIFLDEVEGVTDTIQILIPNPKKWVKEEEPILVKEVAAIEKPIKKGVEEAVKNNTKSSPCINVANSKDFLKLRKSMAAQTNDEAMIAEARKIFKAKCFTTEQIRNLSALFLTSAAKYQFFDAAFEHVSDSGEFASLGGLIKDEYYAKRFKALIGD